MRILSVTLDRRVLDPQSPVGQRQAAYYRGHEVSYLSLDDPKRSKLAVFLSALREAHRARGFDLVTAQDPFFCGLTGRIAARRSKTRLHIQDHSGAFGRKAFGWKEKLLRLAAKKILRKADRVRTVSARGKNGLIAIGVPASKIDVIPIATDVSRFAGIGRGHALQNELLCIARLEREKGLDVLLQAFALLRMKRPEAALVIVGDGSQRKKLERLARGLGIASSVLFAGAQADVRPYLERAGLYVQPSRFEGWGVAVIEAAAAGVPVVMTDVGCAGEVITDGVSGVVVPPDHPQALADGLFKCLAETGFAARLASEARTRALALPSPDATAQAIRESFELCAA